MRLRCNDGVDEVPLCVHARVCMLCVCARARARVHVHTRVRVQFLLLSICISTGILLNCSGCVLLLGFDDSSLQTSLTSDISFICLRVGQH